MSPHLFLVHFPVALLVVGAAADLLGAATGRREWRRLAGTLVVLGGLAAFAAFVTGEGALSRALPDSAAEYARVEAHTQWGGVGVWVLAAAAGLRLAWRRSLDGGRGWALVAVSLAAAALAVAISWTGTLIRHAGSL